MKQDVLKQLFIKLLEHRHPECFYKPTTFKVDKEILANELVALLESKEKETLDIVESTYSDKEDLFWLEKVGYTMAKQDIIKRLKGNKE